MPDLFPTTQEAETEKAKGRSAALEADFDKARKQLADAELQVSTLGREKNGLGEEVFFRGALYGALGERHPVAASTAVYTLATVPTRNPALVLAAGVMGTLFGLQRRASGGLQAPALTHLTWSTLMLRYLPPLFRAPEDTVIAAMRRALR